MARIITKKQKKFADKYIETGNGAQAARETYDVSTDESARAIASQNLTKPPIQEYLQSKAEIAASIVFQIAQFGESDDVKLKASKDILDRAGYKAAEKHINVNVEVAASPKVKELAAKLNELYRGNAETSFPAPTLAAENKEV